MFRIRNTVTPVKDRFRNALRQLPQAHMAAANTATAHLHRVTSQAASAAGMDSDAVVFVRHHTAPYVGLARTVAGEAIADREYGSPEGAPDPVLRTALRAAHPEAQQIYHRALRQGLGL